MATANIHIQWDLNTQVDNVKVEYKKKAANTWTVPTSPANPTSNIQYPLTVEMDVVYQVKLLTKMKTSCSSCEECDPYPVVYEFYVDSNEANNTVNCPPGYTLSDDETVCFKVDTMPAQQESGGTTVTACHYTALEYANAGSWLFKKDGYNQDGTYKSGKNPYHLTQNGLWMNGNLETDRENKASIWACSSQTYAGDLGFSRSFHVPQNKIYYVALAGDNRVNLKINGDTIINQDPNALNAQSEFNKGIHQDRTTFCNFFIYPVELSSGQNTLSILAHNAGSIGMLSCEIYDATEAQIKSWSSHSQVENSIIFSTAKPSDGGNVGDNSNFDIGNWYCADPNYTLVYDEQSSSYSCQKIDRTNPI